MNYFRKKSIQDIHKQIEAGQSDSHESLGKHLKTRDLAAFGIAAIIGEGGRNERVEPLDKDGLSVRDRAIIAQLAGAGGATINVYPSAGMNERELADLVSRRLAFELRRGAA
jgi:hypothetical protein